MATLVRTKLTKGGQTTIPKEIRDALDMTESSDVYWTFDGSRASISSVPPVPNEIGSETEFWQGIEAAMNDVSAGRLVEAGELSASIRERLNLA